jgi:predicted secreted protein
MGDNTQTIVWKEQNHDNSNLYVEIVKRNSNIKISLSGVPSTGYTWMIHEFKPNALTWTNDNEYLTEDYESGLIGMQGNYVFKFSPVKVGSQELELHYKRHWEKNTEPIYVVRYFINVVE